MEDAIDDWLLRQIHWLRRDDIIAQGIRWVQDVRIQPIITIIILLYSNFCNMKEISKKRANLLLILYFFQVLWPDGTFFIKLGNAQSNDDETEPNQKPFQTTTQFGGSKISFEQQLEAARRASEVKKMLFGEKRFPFKSSIFIF